MILVLFLGVLCLLAAAVFALRAMFEIARAAFALLALVYHVFMWATGLAHEHQAANAEPEGEG